MQEWPTIWFAGRGPVQHEEGHVRAEDPRGAGLGGADRARVVHERPQFPYRHRQIRPEYLLTEEVVEHPADRRLEERRAAGVAWGVPRVFVLAGEVGERGEERGQQAPLVAAHGEGHPPGDERGSVLEQPHVFLDLPAHLQRKVPGNRTVGQQEDRQVSAASAHLADQCGCLLPARSGRPELPVQQQAPDGLVFADLGRAVAGRRGPEQAETLGAQAVGDPADRRGCGFIRLAGHHEHRSAQFSRHWLTRLLASLASRACCAASLG